jgi:subfamily B ATP-binding cassette protein MsbA
VKDIKYFLKYLQPHRRKFAAAVVLSVLYGVSSGLGIPLILEKVLKAFFEQTPEGFSWVAAISVATLLPLMFLLRSFAGFFGALLMAGCGFRFLQALRQDVFDKIQELPLAYFDGQKRGDLFSRILVDSGEISGGIIDVATEFLRQPFQMLAALGYIFYACHKHDLWQFLLILVVMFPAVILPVRLIARHLRRRAKNYLEAASEIAQSLSENLGALREIRAYNLQDMQRKRFGNALGRSVVESLKLFKYQKMNQPIMEVLTACVVSATFIASLKIAIPFEVFFAMGSALYFCFDPAKKLTKAYNQYTRMRPAFDRINAIINEPVLLRDPVSPKTLPNPRGRVTLEHVCFSYDTEPVVRDFSLDIPPGSSLALVGPSGAGKSTIVNLLLRFYDTDSGAVRVDGEDARDLTRFHLRDQFALVSQSPFLFNATVFENIVLSRPDAMREEVEAASRKAHAHEFIMAMEQGYDTTVGDDGGRLSGGQRQRIALARAFLKPAPIVVLDEATSALDTESERAVKRALRELMATRTVIAISHRLSFIEHFDRICVMESGRIAGLGSHSELYGHNAIYTRLYDQYHRTHDGHSADSVGHQRQ